jgi:membrane protease subunit HflC
MTYRPVLAVLALGGATAALSCFTLDAREVAVVTAFGAPERTLTEPGLYLRAPWPLHEVVRFDARARLFEVPAAEMLTGDKKNVVAAVFAVWRVKEPRRFLETVRTFEAAESQLADLVTSRVASAVGSAPLAELLSTGAVDRPLLPDSVRTEVSEVALSRLGIEVLDVRLRHLGLPLQNEQSIYERMRAERLRIANAYRSEGEQQAAEIRARADREAAEILAQAEREAGEVRAVSERDAALRASEAYRADPQLFQLLGALDSYRAILGSDDVVVLDGDSTFFQSLTEAPR